MNNNVEILEVNIRSCEFLTELVQNTETQR